MTQVVADTPVMDGHTALKQTAAINLEMVRLKLADPKEGKGWDQAQLDIAEREYRRFLALHLMYPEMSVVPWGTVDDGKQADILDTAAYGPDCDAVFGFFLHHFPYFGMRSDDDAADLVDAYDLTIARYERAFGNRRQGCGSRSTAASASGPTASRRSAGSAARRGSHG